MLKPEKEKVPKPDLEIQVGQGLACLGKTHVLDGELTGEEDLFLKGAVKGQVDLRGHTLVVEHGARVDGDIIVNDLVLRGTVIGNVFAAGKVLVSAEAHMRGDITASRISIAEGAVFKGSIRMEEGAEPPPAKDKRKEKHDTPLRFRDE